MKSLKAKVVKINGCNVKVEYFREIFHAKYFKRLKQNSFLTVHSNLDLKIGDMVLVKSCAPISKTKKHIIEEKIS